MVITGITGGIGSGKTTVCNVWRSLGAYVVNSDNLGKELMVRDPQLVRHIRNEFGDEAYLTDGSLNGKYLADPAFRDGRIKVLNRLVLLVLYREVEILKERAENEGVTMFFHETVILLNKGRPDNFDTIVLVAAKERLRAKRVKKRDGLSDEETAARINTQPDFDKWRPLCDYVLENNSTIKQLEEKAVQLYNKIVNSEKVRRK